MKITLRLFPSYKVDNQLEWNWQFSEMPSEALERYTRKPMEDFESFFRAWSSVLFRFEYDNVNEPKVQDELENKSTWLGNLIEWESHNVPESVTEIIFISEDKWLALPLEILTFNGTTLYPQIPIQRKAKTNKKPLPSKQNTKLLFFFSSTDKGELQESLKRERLDFLNLLQNREDVLFFFGQQARKERLREYLPQANSFYLGSHMEQDSIVFQDGSRITTEELESWNLSGLQLAFLNGCYSGGKLSSAFLVAGCKEVFGYSFAVPNEIAERNALTFWTRWNETHSSLQAAKAVKDSLEDSIFKYIFVHYLAIQNSTDNLINSKTVESPFKKSIVDLTKNFKGREEELVKILPMDNYPGIIFIFSSREVSSSRNLYLEGIAIPYRQEIFIQGLKPEDIKALFYDYIDQYEIQSEYLEEIVSRSQGNPLYLRLLCNSLVAGESKLNDIQTLPKEIRGFYEAIHNRFFKSSFGEKIWELLLLLTSALDSLHVDTISRLLGIFRPTTDLIIKEATEVLFENPLTENYKYWQLFHESLREYIKDEYPREVSKMETRLFEVCKTWKKLCEEDDDPHTIRYVLKYYVQHLLSNKDENKTSDIVLNPNFIDAQIRHLKFYDSTLKDAELALSALISEVFPSAMVRNFDKLSAPLRSPDAPKEQNDSARLLSGVDASIPMICQLALHAGEMGVRAESDIHIAFEWARNEGLFEDAVQRVSVLKDEKELFKAMFLLLWIASTREEESDEINKYNCEYILRMIDEKIPPEMGTVDWSELIGVSLATEIMANVLKFTDDIFAFNTQI